MQWNWFSKNKGEILVFRIIGGAREFLAVSEWRLGMLNPLQYTGQTLYKKN